MRDDSIIPFLAVEMGWNPHHVTYIESTDEYEYWGMEGSGLTRYLQKSCQRFGVTTKIYRGDIQYRGAGEHNYYIKILRRVRPAVEPEEQ